MELWILLGLVLIAFAACIVLRLRRRRRPVDRDGPNIYPLW